VNFAVFAPLSTVTLPGTESEGEVSDNVTVSCAAVPAAGPLSVTVPVEFATPPSTLAGLMVTEMTDGGTTVSVADCAAVVPTLADINTPVDTPCASGFTLNVINEVFTGTVTVAGSVAIVMSPLVSVTSIPPAGAVPFNVTVPVEVWPDTPPTMEAGLRDTLATAVAKGVTVRVALWLPLSVVVIKAVACETTESLVTVKVAVVAPAATVTFAATVAAAVLLLDSATAIPPVGAGPFRVTVPVEFLDPPVTDVGFRETDKTAGGLIVSWATAMPL
jgi:hypothetical protein